MASLFGKNKIREIASKLSTSSIGGQIAIAKTWHQDYHSGSLKQDKETSREQAYNQDFFIKILGYKEKPAAPYSFEPKATTEQGQLPDAVIGYTDANKDVANISAVVELKGALIALDRPQRREGNMSPVQQGFKYKTQYRNCPFVIVSNFWELRLYHDNQLDYEVWTLDDLVDPADDYLKFKIFYTLLHSENFTSSKGSSKTEDLLSDIRFEQEEIGKKFYKVYREARYQLLRNIFQKNSVVRADIDMGIEKAQKIIDRVVFACFAEDKGLLPDNTLQRVVKAADGSAFGGSLWSTLKGFFEAIDVGSDKLEIPDGYNGGLFKRDEALDNLQIGDDVLRKVLELSNYNFAEDLSINILGHIFEQSISDLEEIKNKVNEKENLETLQQSRRKKDGIFYTPDYIVRYIVENSLGTYLREHEELFKQEFNLKGDINDTNYEKREKQAYAKYQAFLQGVKVLDSACGSGAFLVYVFDYLLAENKRVASILGNLFAGDVYVKSILKNNIYGVDLNEESVEITKLSLWLKTAQKGKKLTVLDQNIKCGNSLIDDPAVAGSKAFNWQQEFPEIFKDGGFDVVVGNPPYGAKMLSSAMTYFTKNYSTTKYKLETYSLFTENGINLLKSGGYLSFIMPYTWLTIQQHSKLRELVLENRLVKILDLPRKVFQDADLDTIVFVLQKAKPTTRITVEKMNKDTSVDQSYINTKHIHESKDLLININANDLDRLLILKMTSRAVVLKNIFKVSQGYIPYRRSDLVKMYGTKEGDAIVDERQWHSSAKLNDEYKQEIGGKDLGRYIIAIKKEVFIKYGKHVASYVAKVFFTSPRVLIMEVTRGKKYKLTCVYTEEEYYNSPSIINIIHPDDDKIQLKAMLAILNSSLMSWYHAKVDPKANAKTSIPKILVGDVRNLPIIVSKNPKELADSADSMIAMNNTLLSLSKDFQSIISSEFHLEKWPNKLNKWWVLEFPDFVSALKAKLSLQQKDQLLSLFNKYRNECLELDNEIQKTDKEIDQLVYKLYDLTSEEIKIVEGGENV